MLKLRSRGHVTQLIFFPTLIRFLLRKKTFFCYANKCVATQKTFFATFFFLFQSLNVGLQPNFLICNTFFYFCLFVCLFVFFLLKPFFFHSFFLVFSFHLIYLCYSSFFVSNVVFLFWFKALKVILLMIFFYFLILLYIDFALFISVCISVFFAVYFFSVSHFFFVFLLLLNFSQHLLCVFVTICFSQSVLQATFFRPLVVM